MTLRSPPCSTSQACPAASSWCKQSERYSVRHRVTRPSPVGYPPRSRKLRTPPSRKTRIGCSTTVTPAAYLVLFCPSRASHSRHVVILSDTDARRATQHAARSTQHVASQRTQRG